IGNILDRCITDAGYRGPNAPRDHKLKVYTTGQKRRLTPQINREFKLRAAIEPMSSAISSNITAWAAVTLPCPRKRRRQQRRARCRRLKFPPPPRVVEIFFAQNLIVFGLAAQLRLA